MSELKPCPFCGNDNQSLFSLEPESGTRRSQIVCVICEAAGPLVPGYDWNFRRADAVLSEDSSTPPAELVERLRSQMAWLDQFPDLGGPAPERWDSLLRDLLAWMEGKS